MLLTYCPVCKKRTDNVCQKKLIMMTNVKIKEMSTCADCLANKSSFSKI